MHRNVHDKRIFCKRSLPYKNYKRESKIKGSLRLQKKHLIGGAVYQDYSVTRVINEENTFISTSCNRERKNRLGKFTPEMITTGSFYIHSRILLINLECITAEIN